MSSSVSTYVSLLWSEIINCPVSYKHVAPLERDNKLPCEL